LEPLAAQQNRVNYEFDKVKLLRHRQTSGRQPGCLYEPSSDDEMEHEEAESELTESLKQLCTQDTTRPGRTVLQDIVEEAEGTQPDHGPKDDAVPAD